MVNCARNFWHKKKLPKRQMLLDETRKDMAIQYRNLGDVGDQLDIIDMQCQIESGIANIFKSYQKRYHEESTSNCHFGNGTPYLYLGNDNTIEFQIGYVGNDTNRIAIFICNGHLTFFQRFDQNFNNSNWVTMAEKNASFDLIEQVVASIICLSKNQAGIKIIKTKRRTSVQANPLQIRAITGFDPVILREKRYVLISLQKKRASNERLYVFVGSPSGVRTRVTGVRGRKY